MPSRKNDTVEDFILGLDGQQKAIVSFLHQYIVEQHHLIPKINWNIPAYYNKNWICYLNPIKNEGIELAFFRGKDLSNEQGVLLSKGRKLVCGIDFFSIEEIDIYTIRTVIHEAVILDELIKR